MAKRSHPKQRDHAREAQILNTPVKDLMSEMVVREFINKMSDPNLSQQELLQLQLQLQAFVRGDASLLANINQPAVAEQVNKMREQRVEQDKAEEAFAKNPQQFIDDVYAQADRIRAKTPEEKNRRIASAMEKYRTARQRAAAERSVQMLEFSRKVETGPKVLVHVTPEYETISTSQGPVVKEVPVVISAMGKRYILKTGDQMVPEVLAKIYLQKRRLKESIAEREQAMDFNRQRENSQVQADLMRIAKKYNDRYTPIIG